MEAPQGGQQVFEATALRHPCAYMSRAAGCFVPNDVRLGGAEPPFVLLTGAHTHTPSCLDRTPWTVAGAAAKRQQTVRGCVFLAAHTARLVD